MREFFEQNYARSNDDEQSQCYLNIESDVDDEVTLERGKKVHLDRPMLNRYTQMNERFIQVQMILMILSGLVSQHQRSKVMKYVIKKHMLTNAQFHKMKKS